MTRLSDDPQVVRDLTDVFEAWYGSDGYPIGSTLAAIQPHVERLIAEAVAKERAIIIEALSAIGAKSSDKKPSVAAAMWEAISAIRARTTP